MSGDVERIKVAKEGERVRHFKDLAQQEVVFKHREANLGSHLAAIQ